MVLPTYQRQGIGSTMTRYALNELSLGKLPVWLHTQVREWGFYKKFSLNEVDCLAVDMSRWKGEDMGFGMHRSPCMMREPGVAARVEIGC